MATIDATKIQIQRQYVFGMTLEKEAIRRHKYTVTLKGNELFKDEFYSETHTPRTPEFDWGKGETVFFWDNKDKQTYKSVLEVLQSKYQVINIPEKSEEEE